MMMKWLTLSLFFVLSAAAQTQTTGRLTGSVIDQRASLIPSANVTVTNKATGDERSTTTDEAGSFTFAFLAPGVYRVRVGANGFQTFTSENIKISIAESTSLRIILAVAGVTTEPVTVSSGGPILKTDSATLGWTFGLRAISEIPLSTTNFTQLLGSTAGANVYLADNTVVGRNTQNVSVNGARVSQNNFQINGIDANAGTSFRPLPNPALESIAEVNVQTSVFDATFGRSGGANVQVVTKSGTSGFHGSVYGSSRLTGLSANSPYLKAARLPRPVLERTVYGATVSGPLRPDRSFFFLSYQGTRERNGASRLHSLSNNVLIDARLTDDRTDAGLLASFPGLNIHSVSRMLLRATLSSGQYLIPTPQVGGRYFASSLSHYREEQFNVNVDYRFGRKNMLTAKFFFSDAPETLAREGNVNVPGFRINNAAKNVLASVQDVHSFSAGVTNEARIGLNLVRFASTTSQPFLDSGFGIGRPTAIEYPGMPIIRIAQNAGGIGFGTQAVRDAHGSIPTLSFADTISTIRRSHFIRAGFEKRYYGNNITLPIQTRGNIIFQNFTRFLEGRTQSAALSNGITDRSFRAMDYNFFLQNDWRISPSLTLNLGVRYELDLPPFDTRGRIATFDPSLYAAPIPPRVLVAGGFVQAGNALSQYDLAEIPNEAKSVLNSIDPNNLAPRIGFAWSPNDNQHFVFRGGYGIFYSRSNFGYLFSNIFHQPFYFQGIRLNNNAPPPDIANPFPSNFPSQFPTLQATSLLVGNAFDRNIRTPYIEQLNLSVQFGLSRDMQVEAAYVSTRGHKLFRQVAINQARLTAPSEAIANTPATAQSRAPFQGVAVGGAFLFDQTTAQSNYNALQAVLTRRMSHGLQMLVSYTFSKAIDNASGTGGGAGTTGILNVGENLDSGTITSNQLDDRANRGLSNFDRKHRFVSTFIWELPRPSVADHSRVGRLLLSGWQVSGIITAMSGLPIDVIDSGAGTLYFGQAGGGRPNWVNGRSTTDNIPPGYYFNPYAFARAIVLNGQVIPSSGGLAVAGPACLATAMTACTDLGNVGRNALRGPRQFNTDLSISRRFRFGETSDLVIRAEFFNLFNTVNFANPISNFASVIQTDGAINPSTGEILPGRAGDFGKIISTSANQRIIQFAARINF